MIYAVYVLMPLWLLRCFLNETEVRFDVLLKRAVMKNAISGAKANSTPDHISVYM